MWYTKPVRVAQNLAALKIYLEQEDFSKSKFYVNQALNEIRYMIGSGSIAFTKDFEKIVREICIAFEVNFGLKTNLYVASQKIVTLKNTQKTHLIRILQEALSNISRHSDATQVEIKFVDGIDDFRFIICDNRKGFEETEVESKKLKTAVKHYGLTNIKKRVRLIGGNADFINEGGFTIAIIVKDSVR
ncbi:ATPase/histidine kinase/DNA gyrase B/HSP90 domain protein [Treponema vincentii ATCC 35580]|uniref:histidine kinase n=1 Tax=Treponema vincentii ATCC 35580 TaxID=596324 RepID=C8PU09_9SPIR|nr:ATP-binding protein [Treponema vincentii]EEV19148.1 ATPase/histidine kinase/DNA gyrase B/HSP90 domain protein [Treponema vincentii ATCC 35580]